MFPLKVLSQLYLFSFYNKIMIFYLSSEQNWKYQSWKVKMPTLQFVKGCEVFNFSTVDQWW